MVADTSISKTLEEVADPQAACDKLVEMALNGGGKDNITLILCDIADMIATRELAEKR